MYKDYHGSPVEEPHVDYSGDYTGSTLESIEADTQIGLLQESEEEMDDKKLDIIVPEPGAWNRPDELLQMPYGKLKVIEPRHIGMAELTQMAEAIAKSGLFGMKNVDQALALMLISQAEGRHPALAARDYDIIQGRVSKKSEAVLRDFLECGGKVKWIVSSDLEAEATFSHPSGGSLRIRWDMKTAERAGLAHKDNWKKYPRQMLRARCVSEGVRAVAPMATSGMYVPEEVQDFDNDYRKPPEKAVYATKVLSEKEVDKDVLPKSSTLKDQMIIEFKRNLEEACKRLPKSSKAKLIAKAFCNPNLNEDHIERLSLEEISKANLKLHDFLTKEEK